MKLLLDQGLPRSTASILCSKGIDTIHVGEIGLADAEDEVILERGRAEGRIIVTLDADFHALMALRGATTPSVIRIRIQGLRAETLTQLLQQILIQFPDELTAGALVTIRPGRWRLKRLPIR